MTIVVVVLAVVALGAAGAAVRFHRSGVASRAALDAARLDYGRAVDVVQAELIAVRAELATVTAARTEAENRAAELAHGLRELDERSRADAAAAAGHANALTARVETAEAIAAERSAAADAAGEALASVMREVAVLRDERADLAAALAEARAALAAPGSPATGADRLAAVLWTLEAHRAARRHAEGGTPGEVARVRPPDDLGGWVRLTAARLRDEVGVEVRVEGTLPEHGPAVDAVLATLVEEALVAVARAGDEVTVRLGAGSDGWAEVDIATEAAAPALGDVLAGLAVTLPRCVEALAGRVEVRFDPRPGDRGRPIAAPSDAEPTGGPRARVTVPVVRLRIDPALGSPPPD
jgi:hypothetical protein